MRLAGALLVAAALLSSRGASAQVLDHLTAVHEDLVDAVDAFLAERGVSWSALDRRTTWNSPSLPFAGLPELRLYVLCSDPVLWSETYLLESQDDGGGPWRFFDYQKAPLRYQGSKILKCGAETGKSRLLLAEFLWRLHVKSSSQLMGAALDGHLESLWEDAIALHERNPFLHRAIDWGKTKVKPYKVLTHRNGHRIYFRPAGNKGKAFRGIHVAGGACMDEAAVVEDQVSFDELRRATKPKLGGGAQAPITLVSVPDGRTDSAFYGLCQRATEVRTLAEAQALPPSARPMFRWRKPDMPPPFWTPERREEYILDFGGIDSPGYLRNVLGEDGPPASSVFPERSFGKVLRLFPRYRFASLLWNDAEQVITSRVHACGPSWDEPLELFAEDEFDLDAFELHLERYLPADLDVSVLGGDLGSQNDPTEILGFTGAEPLRAELRIQLRGFPYPVQRQVFSYLHRRLRPRWGWGVDATGSGAVVEQEIRASGDHALAMDLSGFVLNKSVAAMNPSTGEEMLDPQTGQPLTVSYKEQGTRLLEYAVEHQAIEFHRDPSLVASFQGHTANLSKNGTRTYPVGKNRNDHPVEAARVAVLRRFLLDHGALSSAPLIVLPVPGYRRSERAFGAGNGSLSGFGNGGRRAFS